MSGYVVTQSKPKAFYERYERKAELQHQTHYCPGCGHGIVHKMIAKAIDQLNIQDRTILVSPVGCSVFAYYYFDVGNIQGAHGRAPAVATAVKRSHPHSVVISYQGDGDLSAIGCAEIIHAANRGENITVVCINNAIYGMTGGQMAPTTLLGQKSTTTPFGRSAANEGYPLRISELLATLEAPVYIARVALGDNRQLAHADRAIAQALDNQVKGLGFSLVEVLSPCPTVWKMDPVEAQHWVRDEMTKTYPLGVLRDLTRNAQPRAEPASPAALEQVPEILGLTPGTPPSAETAGPLDQGIKIAGFGGQGVLLLGEVLAEAGLASGLEVTWLPSYGPEQRSGTSNCHVRLSRSPIDSPLVSRPHVLLAMNEPSLRKFASSVQPGGWIFYNGAVLPEGCRRPDARIVAQPFTQIAGELGESRAANIVMLGTFLAATSALGQEQVLAVLARLVKNARWLELDRAALQKGVSLYAG